MTATVLVYNPFTNTYDYADIGCNRKVEFAQGDFGEPTGPDPDGIIHFVTGPGLKSTSDPDTYTVTFVTEGSGLDWDEKVANFDAVASYGYFIDGPLTASLPSATQGDTISFITNTKGVFTVVCDFDQYIQIGNKTTALAGNVTCQSNGSSLRLVYMSSISTWKAEGCLGTWTIN